MDSQFYPQGCSPLALAGGQALSLAGRAGRLSVENGQVWLTRDGDLDDHVLGPGDSFVLAARDAVVLEPWRRDEAVRLAWCPESQPRRVRGLFATLADAARTAVS